MNNLKDSALRLVEIITDAGNVLRPAVTMPVSTQKVTSSVRTNITVTRGHVTVTVSRFV